MLLSTGRCFPGAAVPFAADDHASDVLGGLSPVSGCCKVPIQGLPGSTRPVAAPETLWDETKFFGWKYASTAAALCFYHRRSRRRRRRTGRAQVAGLGSE